MELSCSVHVGDFLKIIEIDMFETSLLLGSHCAIFLFANMTPMDVFIVKKSCLDMRWTCSVHSGDFLEMLKFLWFIVKDLFLYI